ncbi:MAG: formate--tetrahydrofolate ligase [Sandaracinaceae bacterium]|nr:formate--tetrahydrofolate ligase [Sandaracinaceae bacterium]
MRPIHEVAAELGVDPAHVLPYGRDKAKIELAALERRAPRAKLVLVSAITPTKAGEGKTTTSVALAMGLAKIGERSVACLREPSLGPVFGIKGGGTGGGRAQLEPAADINLHFTGDLHAITSAHNLLSALIDNDLHFGAASGLDPRSVTWPRALDMNDRALRQVVVGLGGVNGGVPRETRFDITAASEVMAILGLASSMEDLTQRLGRIVVGHDRARAPVTAKDLGADVAMAALLKDALAPNLAQTREGTPALVHGGPFANIAHGCSSVLATRLGLAYADFVVTEAGFGFDLGGEKFFDIKCRAAGLWPDAVVLVVTARALASHGAGELAAGLANLDHHLESVRRFGVTPLVAINVFPDDSSADLSAIKRHCEAQGVACAQCRGFADGGEGARELASLARDAARAGGGEPRFLYELEASYADKIEAVARGVYGADGVVVEAAAARVLDRLEASGVRLPICVAKTPLSISDDPSRVGRPRGFTITVREARLSAGAGFVVLLTGDVMTMPGLPKVPAARGVRLVDGRIVGLMQNE